MKSKTSHNQLTKLALAIMGTMLLASTAQANTELACNTNNSDPNKTLIECKQATPGAIQLATNIELTKKEYQIVIDNPEIEVNSSANAINQTVKLTDSEKHKVSFDLKNFKKFTTSGNAQVLNFAVENKNSQTHDANVDLTLNINGNDNSLISDANKGTSTFTYGLAMYRRTKGSGTMNINDINIDISSNTQTVYNIHNVAYTSGNSDVIFNNGTINTHGVNTMVHGITNVFKYSQKETPSFELDSDIYSQGRVYTQFNNGKITLKSTLGVAQALVTQIENDTSRNTKTEVNGGEIYTYGGLANIPVLIFNGSKLDSESFIEQNGGRLYAGGDYSNGQWTKNDKAGIIKGLAIRYEGDTIALGKIHQNKGLVEVAGTGKADNNTFFYFPSAVHIVAAKSEFVQGKEAQAIASGDNTAGAILFATKEGILADIDGTLTANNYGLYTNTRDKELSTIKIRDNAKIDAEVAIFNNSGDSEIDIATGSTLGTDSKLTSIKLEDGDDKLTFNGTNLDHIQEIDGGLDIDTQNEFDTLRFNAYTDLDFTQKIKNWERIELANGTYSLTQNLDTGIGSSKAGLAGGLVLDKDAVLSLAKNSLAIRGDLHNTQGTIDLRRNDNTNSNLTVSGDYYGGGTILFNVSASSNNTQHDQLTITGDIKGQTAVAISIINNEGVVAEEGVKLVALADNSSAEQGEASFILANKVDIGSYEYNTIAYKDVKGEKGFYLESSPIYLDSSANSSYISNSSKKTSLLRKAIPGYVLAQQAHAHTLSGIYATLHERMGEQRTVMNSVNGKQSWVRIFADKNTLNTNGIELKNQEFFEQFGWDFYTNKDKLVRSGVFATYAKVNSSFTDNYRDPGKVHGRIDNDFGSLGLYHTAYNQNGSYLDTVAGLHYIYSDFEVVDGGNQYAYGGSLSVEGGSRFNYKNHYYFEPQAQLSYQFTQYLSFRDNKEEVQKYSAHSLRPRVGFRLGYKNTQDSNLWFHANANFELLKTTAVEIGKTSFSADRAQKSWYDLGLNGQVQLSPSKVFYSSVFYKHSFKGQSFKEFGAKLGLRFTW